MSSSRRRFTAVLLAGALLTAACSGGGGEEEAAENPKQAFGDAVEALSEYEGITLEMSIAADPGDLASADLPADAAEKLVDSTMTVSVKGTTPEDAQAEITFDVAGHEAAAEFKIVDQSLYARADVRELAEEFGADASMIDTTVQQAAAAGFDFVEPLANGDWVGIEGLGELAEQFGGVQPSADPKEAAAVLDRIVAILDENAEVSSEGTDDVGAHLLVRVPMQDTVAELMDALQGLSGAPEGAFPTDALEDVPDGDLPLDVWISDGRLVQVELDFVAAAKELGGDPPEGIEEMALRVALDEFTEDVEPPSDFTEIDLQQILQGFFGAVPMTTPETEAGSEAIEVPAGNGGMALPELGVACSDLEMLSPQDIQTFLEASGQPDALKKVKKACPELF